MELCHTKERSFIYDYYFCIWAHLFEKLGKIIRETAVLLLNNSYKTVKLVVTIMHIE